MPTKRSPRKGSMQFWPRKRARSFIARARSWPLYKEANLLGFAGYKVGMTHVVITDNRPTSLTKGQEISCPVTVIECPPLKALSVRFYKKTDSGLAVSGEVLADKLDKELVRRISMPKKQKKKIDEVKDFDDLRLVVHTQPKLTGIGKKRPELMEMAIGGSKEDKLRFAKETLGKEISVKDVFKVGELLDVRTVTKGRGYQGPVRRFGVSIRHPKSEKTKRGPANVGPWTGGKQWRVAKAGQTGCFRRTEYNKLLLKISENLEEINPKGGFVSYGFVKNPYVIVSGSIPGPRKRLIRLSHALRPNTKAQAGAPTINEINLELEKKA